MNQAKIITGLAVATLSTSVGVVHAEDVTPVTEASTTNETVTVPEVTQSQVDSAKAIANQASSDVNAQQNVVNDAQKSVDQAQANVVNATTAVTNAEKLVEEATPEAISVATNEVTSASTNVSTIQNNLTNSEATVNQIETQIANQAQTVSHSEQIVSKEKQDVVDAQNAVDQAQASLDGTNSKQVITEANSASANLAEMKQKEAVANANLLTAQTADAKLANDIATTESNIVDAENVLNEKITLSNQATNNANTAVTNLNLAQTNYNKALNDLNAINTIVFTNEYIQALKDYALNYTTKGAQAKAILDKISSDVRALNSFKANANDDQTLLDINNLTDNQLTELSLFASDLVNQIHKQFGTGLVVTTKDAVKFADLVTDGYVADDWQSTKHDAKAVNVGASQMGLVTSPSDQEALGMQYYENLNTWPASSPSITLSDAKRKIYSALLNLFFNGYEYLHAESLSGLKDGSATTYLGVDLSSRTNANSVHFLTVKDSDFANGSTFDKNAITNSNNAEVVKANYDKTTQLLTDAKSVNDQAQAEKKVALQNQIDAQNALINLNKALSALKAQQLKTPNAKQQLAEAQVQLAQAEERNQLAQEALANLNADVKTKMTILDQAKSNLAVQNNELSQAINQLMTDKETLSNLESQLLNAKDKVTAVQNQLVLANKSLELKQLRLASLQNAPQILKEAETNLSLAKLELSRQLDNLNNQNIILQDLKVQENLANENYLKVKEAYQAILEAKRQAMLAEEYASILSRGGHPIPVIDESGQISGYVDGNKKTDINETNFNLTSTDKSPANQENKLVSSLTNDLPNTGEASVAPLTVIGAIILSVLGLTSLKKRRTH